MKRINIIVLLLLIGQFVYGQKTKGKIEMENSDRYNRGWEKLKDIDGEAGRKVINSLKDISPDLGKFIIEYATELQTISAILRQTRQKLTV